MTSFKPRVHEESEVEKYLSWKCILRACYGYKWFFD